MKKRKKHTAPYLSPVSARFVIALSCSILSFLLSWSLEHTIKLMFQATFRCGSNLRFLLDLAGRGGRGTKLTLNICMTKFKREGEKRRCTPHPVSPSFRAFCHRSQFLAKFRRSCYLLEPGTHYSTDVPGIYFYQKTIGQPAQSRYVNTREPTLFTYVGFLQN